MPHLLGVGLLLLRLVGGSRFGRSGHGRARAAEAEGGTLGVQRRPGVDDAVARFDAEDYEPANSPATSLTSARSAHSIERGALARRSASVLFRCLAEEDDAPPMSQTNGSDAAGYLAESPDPPPRAPGEVAHPPNVSAPASLLESGQSAPPPLKPEAGSGKGAAELLACRGYPNCFGHGSHFVRECPGFCSADQNCSAYKWRSDPPQCAFFTAGACPIGMQHSEGVPRTVTEWIPDAPWHCSTRAVGTLPKTNAPTPTTPGSHPRQGHGKVSSPLPIAIAVQLHNPEVWKQLRGCVANVVAAAQAMPERRISIDLHVALTRHQPSFEDEVRRTPGVADVTTTVVKNRGADIGEFLQQLPQLRAGRYAAMLKLHSKSDPRWRDQMLSSLCGSAERVQMVLRMFDENRKLGIVGPSELIWGWKVDTPTFNNLAVVAFGYLDMERYMANAWKIIYPRDPVPDRSNYLIAAGSIFWLRSEPLLSDSTLMSAIPAILDKFPDGWDHKLCENVKYRFVHAMERVIPTLIRAKYGLDFAEAPPFTSRKAA